MKSKYDINQTVYFLHGQKAMSGRITAIYMRSELDDRTGATKTTENYTVEFDVDRRGAFDQEREISVVLLHPSREALIESL